MNQYQIIAALGGGGILAVLIVLFVTAFLTLLSVALILKMGYLREERKRMQHARRRFRARHWKQ